MNNVSIALKRLLFSQKALYLSFAVSLFLGLGSVALFDLDEGAFTEATREMLDTGVYSATYLDGEPRYDKPIFFYWLQAASISTFGFNEWAFRLPSALMACLWALALLSFARQYIGRQRGLIAALFMVNSVWVALIARSAIADATLNLFLSLALFDIWRFFDGQRKQHALRVYLWMSLAMLTKGPIGVVVPLLVSLIYLVTNRGERKQYQAYWYFPGWILFLAVLAPWLVAVYHEQGAGFFQGFIVEHNLKRFSATRESHGGSLLYYFGALPLILLPLSGLLFVAIANAKRLWRDKLNRFLLIWFAVVFVIFSFSKTQLPHYILNGCVPLFLLLARQTSLFRRNRWVLVFPIVLALLMVFQPQVLAIAAETTRGYDGANLARHGTFFPPLYGAISIALLVAVLVLTFAPRMRTWQRLVLSGLAINAFVFTQFVQVASEFQQRPVHEAIATLEARAQQTGETPQVVAWRMHMPSFSVYRQQVTPLRAPQPGEIALVRVDRVKALQELLAQTLPEYRNHIIWHFGGLMLVQVDSVPTQQN
ncbi:ArnT family glycosyltransferase [Teredinibacter turnerae]|uniref:ArnT family glycosyltransferase n=1 Tax=Teredinibacter turnerae TaxID=2426 RepID=UPI00041827A6|nr:glycosyltransferase family 39 protein [Teredinibacter turnerae]